MEVIRKCLMVMAAFVRSFARGVGEVMGIAAAKYRAYNEKARAEFHAQRVQEENSRRNENAIRYEYLVLECLYAALKNSAEIMFVTLPSVPEKCFAMPHIVPLKNGRLAYHFWFYYRRDRDMPAEKMTRILKCELAQECYVRGIPSLVPYIALGEDRRAKVLVIWANN